jgi:hypothetical protein
MLQLNNRLVLLHKPTFGEVRHGSRHKGLIHIDFQIRIYEFENQLESFCPFLGRRGNTFFLVVGSPKNFVGWNPFII